MVVRRKSYRCFMVYFYWRNYGGSVGKQSEGNSPPRFIDNTNIYKHWFSPSSNGLKILIKKSSLDINNVTVIVVVYYIIIYKCFHKLIVG